MYFIRRMSTTVTTLALLTACGGSNGTTISSFEKRFEVDAATALALNNTPGTAFAAMPATGSASYTGAAIIFIDPVVETDADDVFLLGDTNLTANFGAGTMTGRIDNFDGATGFTETTVDVSSADGVIRIGNNESIIGNDVDDNRTDRPNDWYADYAGTIVFEGNSYEIEGTIDGQFRGTRADPAAGQSQVRGLVGSSDDGYAVINGASEAPVTLDIFGEN